MDPHDLNLRHLSAVAAVMKTGSVNAAARLVNLTQPAISQGIAKLEQQLGRPLFTRQPGGMEPTAAGLVVGRRAEEALRLMGTRRATNAQVRAFLAFARAGTYSAAAADTGLSQASLHRAIADLSLAIGTPLLERRGRALALTRKGLAAARNLGLGIAEVQSALFELAALDGADAGRIVIGAMPLSRARVLPDAISLFHGRHPNVDLTIAEGSYLELIGPLRDGKIDVMIGALREEQTSDLVSTPLFEDRPAIVGRHGHPLDGKVQAPRADDLLAYPWLVPPVGTPLRALWQAMFEALDVAPPRVAIECGSAMIIRQLLLTSDHLTLLSVDQIAAELEVGWLSLIGPAPDHLNRIIGMTVRTDWRPTAMQTAFLAQLRAAAGTRSE